MKSSQMTTYALAGLEMDLQYSIEVSRAQFAVFRKLGVQRDASKLALRNRTREWLTISRMLSYCISMFE